MLVLTRAAEEEVIIRTPGGEVITIKVLGFINNREVRLGFTAPQNVAINRREVDDDKIKRQAAAGTPHS